MAVCVMYAFGRALAAGFALTSLAAAARAQTPCTVPAGAMGPSRDLYCIEMVPAPGADSARGTVQLDWVPGPFTVSVAADGTHRWNLTLDLAALPESLLEGPAAGFVTWAMPPSLTPLVRLGVVRAGRNRLGSVAFDRFVVLVSAEPDSTSPTRRGPLVLRGESAGNRLRPADNYQFFVGSLAAAGTGDAARAEPRPAQPAQHAHGPPAPAQPAGPAGPAGAVGAPLVWTGVPMYPGLDMLPAEMALRPAERPWMPQLDARASAARPREMVRLKTGDTLRLTAELVERSIAGRRFTMFGFNGQYPGPLLIVAESGSAFVRLVNHLPLPTTVHWHGVRLDNRFDGVPDLTQPAVPPGGTFTYRLRFPDAGIFWYHPHAREDIQQDLGLYGNLFVRPARPEAFGPSDREEFLILDDLLTSDAGLVPYGTESPTHAAMGRFGNVYLVNGETRWRGAARQGEVVRFFLTNAANTRTFNVSFGAGARMKVVGSDLGLYRSEEWVESVVIAPAERYIVDVRFDRPGEVALLNRIRALDHLYGRFFGVTDTLGSVTVRPAPRGSRPSRAARAFDALRQDPIVAAEQDPFLREASRRVSTGASAPDRVLELRVRFSGLPFVTERLMRLDSAFFNPVEWEGTMPGMNWSTTGAGTRWIIRDPATGRENDSIGWRFRVGDVVTLRLVSARDVLHGMQHPIHLHGQRFMVLAVNGIPNQNPVWKDTVLLPAGGTVDLAVEMSNPGRWMLHCHIAEHLHAGMMTVIDVEGP